MKPLKKVNQLLERLDGSGPTTREIVAAQQALREGRTTGNDQADAMARRLACAVYQMCILDHECVHEHLTAFEIDAALLLLSREPL